MMKRRRLAIRLSGVHGASYGGHLDDHGSNVPVYHRCVACSIIAATAIVFIALIPCTM
jgi:hypothetical protein